MNSSRSFLLYADAGSTAGLSAAARPVRSRLSRAKSKMPRYFFDIHDSGSTRDDTGTDCADLDEARAQALQTLPDIAREDILKDGDRRTFTCLVTNEDGHPVYSATLTYTGLWLLR